MKLYWLLVSVILGVGIIFAVKLSDASSQIDDLQAQIENLQALINNSDVINEGQTESLQDLDYRVELLEGSK